MRYKGAYMRLYVYMYCLPFICRKCLVLYGRDKTFLVESVPVSNT